jgi:hypothetical protein
VGLTNVPLPTGARILTQARSCDRGVNPFCSVQLVVVGDRYSSSDELLAGEKDRLKMLGWTISNGPSGPERAAESPGHELRLTYATAYQDLLGIDSSWIQRSPPISHGLAQAMFDRSPAISLLLVRGPS